MVGHANRCDYAVWAICGVIGKDKSFRPLMTPEEVSRIEVFSAWMNTHPNDIFLEALLDEGSLRLYLATQANTRFTNQTIPIHVTIPSARGHFPSPLVEGKGKKPRKDSPVENGSDSVPLAPLG